MSVMGIQRCFLTVCMVIVTGLARADQFDRTVANISILQDKAVQKEVGITEAQRTKMNTYASKFSEQNKSKIDSYNKAKRQPDADFQKFMTAQMARLRDEVLGLMSDAQIKRLRELTLQAVGPRAILDRNVANKIGLSPAQQTKVRNEYASAETKVNALKKQIAAEIEKQFSKKPKPKTEKEAKAFKESVDKAINAQVARRKSEFDKIASQLNKNVSAVVTKPYLEKLFALMGKPFKRPTAPK